jgi:2-polyprenyl-3-methyl-5-hydroxy-6-metoxy-1,4-benzoquinol methylase
MTQWYEELFTNYAKTYENEVFVQGTTGEVDFIEAEISGDKTKTILDIGCGTGRHSIELARRGYTVTGIDLSESQLSLAKEKAAAAGVTIEFIQKDARDFEFTNGFDLAIMLCEGGFSLMETDEMNFRILQNAAAALKSGGKFIFSCLHGLYPMVRLRPQPGDAEESIMADLSNFDLLTLRNHTTLTVTDDSGTEKTLKCNERYYTPSEITWYLKSTGFNKVDIHGCKLGAFSRNDRLTTDDFEMLVIAEK